jgi:hypothetical protein
MYSIMLYGTNFGNDFRLLVGVFACILVSSSNKDYNFNIAEKCLEDANGVIRSCNSKKKHREQNKKKIAIRIPLLVP